MTMNWTTRAVALPATAMSLFAMTSVPLLPQTDMLHVPVCGGGRMFIMVIPSPEIPNDNGNAAKACHACVLQEKKKLPKRKSWTPDPA